MEAPIPIPIETKKPENEEEYIKPKDIKVFKFKSDKDIEYEIKLYALKESIIFEALSKDILPQKKYKKIFSFDDILKSNKYYSMCENLNEIYEESINQINEKEKDIKLYENTKLITIMIPLNTKKIKECRFDIEEIVEDINNQIKDLYSCINQLLKKIDNLEVKNKILEQNNINLEKKVKELDDNLQTLMKEKEKEKEKEFQIIKNWIAPGKEVKLDLIFKKTRDGNTSKAFHKYCDNKGKTLILIETNESRKFGGFTYNNWIDSNGRWKNNENDFVFSLDLNKKYNNLGKSSTLGKLNNGPIFGYQLITNEVDICLKESLNFGISRNSRCFKTNFELNNGKENFETKELEVYEVNII